MIESSSRIRLVVGRFAYQPRFSTMPWHVLHSDSRLLMVSDSSGWVSRGFLWWTSTAGTDWGLVWAQRSHQGSLANFARLQANHAALFRNFLLAFCCSDCSSDLRWSAHRPLSTITRQPG